MQALAAVFFGTK